MNAYVYVNDHQLGDILYLCKDQPDDLDDAGPLWIGKLPLSSVGTKLWISVWFDDDDYENYETNVSKTRQGIIVKAIDTLREMYEIVEPPDSDEETMEESTRNQLKYGLKVSIF